MRKLKIFLSILVAVVVLGGGVAYFAYHNLQPENHFKNVPTVSQNGNNANHSTTTAKMKENVFNVLLLGSDERKGQNVGHSDSIIILHVDLNNHKYSMVSIPRDTRVYLDGYGYTKLTSVQYIKQATDGTTAGIKAAINSISQLTGVPINYYVETNYEGLQSMVETLGTINVDVPFDVKLTHPWYPENKGKVIAQDTQTLNGEMVTELVHERYSLPNFDYDRQLLQEKVLIGIAKQALKPKNLTKLPQLTNKMSDFVIATNMSKSDIASLGLLVKNLNTDKQVAYYQLKGASKTMYDDILKNNNAQIVLDQTSLKQTMKHFE
ncbi:LCP family protein [Weizmannia acidilactici]|uniref:LCP family protein n=1 Tax=Weizmannia acidilactici TaxID=2607726 RepID=UPI00124D3306|nr:LCP family protein [Weizmannia acidilactici]GER74671.1 LytR family transcriptional regulator [Weizmannia acidilactici]